jgi:hypothetical protein
VASVLEKLAAIGQVAEGPPGYEQPAAVVLGGRLGGDLGVELNMPKGSQTNQTTQEFFRQGVDLLGKVVDALRYGFDVNVSAGPMASDLTIEPARSSASSLPWLIAGGAALIAIVLVLGD